MRFKPSHWGLTSSVGKIPLTSTLVDKKKVKVVEHSNKRDLPGKCLSHRCQALGQACEVFILSPRTWLVGFHVIGDFIEVGM